MLRVNLPKSVCAILVWICLPLAACLFAQGDDPFAIKGDDPAQAAPQLYELPTIDPGLPEGTQLIIRAVRASNLATDIDFANSVKLMMDIEQYADAKFYLYQLTTLAKDDASLFNVYESLGSDFFLALHATDGMQPEGRDFAKKVLAIAQQESRSPARLNQYIETLSDSDISVRSVAFRKLRRIGAPAVAAMIGAFADPDRENEFPGIRSALASMGDDAIAPLMGAARATNLQVQAEAIGALANYPSGDATDAILRIYMSPKVPESLRQVAREALERSQRLPVDSDTVGERFYERSFDYLMGRRRVSGTFMDEVVLWQWNAGKKRLEPVPLSSALAARVVAAQSAVDLYEMRPDLPKNRAIYLLTHLEAAKRIVGPAVTIDVKRWIEQFSPTDGNEVNSVLKKALTLDLIPAATACCEILGDIGTSELVDGFGSRPSALVRALTTGDRHLQFAAFDAIAKIDPENAYSGSSFMTLLAVFMASSENRAAALVGHVRSDIAQSYAASLSTAGFFGESVSTGRSFFREAVRDPDLNILLVTDTIDLPDYAELIQQLRKDLRTKRIPIGLLYRNTDRQFRIQRLAENDPFLIAIPFSLAPEFVAATARRVFELSQPWSVTDLDRRRHAVSAVEWLRRISGDREKYGFYDFGGYQDQLAKLLYLPGFADSVSDILVNLGTPTAQRELINFASQNGLSLESRQKAAEAFHRSVKTAGTMLTRGEIQTQYDRYNASENEPESTQKVLGSILDAIEARVKNSD